MLNAHKSSWIQVLSGVPQGSVLGPLLFITFVNDLDDVVISKLLKFADDVKLIGQVASERDVDSLRADLQLLVGRSVSFPEVDFVVLASSSEALSLLTIACRTRRTKLSWSQVIYRAFNRKIFINRLIEQGVD